MFTTLLLAAAALGAPCPPPAFAFAGQPDCVELAYEDGRTRVTNACEHALLIDQSVQVPSASTVLPPDDTTEIRDLSAFTLGLNGALFQVVALVEVPACASSVPAHAGADPAHGMSTRP